MKFLTDSLPPEQKKQVATSSTFNQPTPQTVPHVKIVFCIPGREFTANFLQSWTKLCNALYMNSISFVLSNTYSPVVYYARTACWRGSVLRGRNQKPFNGEITYDYIMWIDSDIVWEPEQFFALLQRMEQNPNLQCLAGTYLMADGYHTTVVDEWDEDYFASNGSFKFLTNEECDAKLKDPKVQAQGGIFEAVYAGFGFFMHRYGVAEMFEYPFFRPQFHELKNGIYDFSSEDSTFFLELREKGVKLFIDPTVKVGHEKQVVIR